MNFIFSVTSRLHRKKAGIASWLHTRADIGLRWHGVSNVPYMHGERMSLFLEVACGRVSK
jgi:hypothetical protein